MEGLIEKGLKTAEGDYVTVAEALAILNSLLRNETGTVIYSYFRADTVGEVERLGLAKDILDLVADDAQALAMGPTGAQPKGFWDWLISVFLFVIFKCKECGLELNADLNASRNISRLGTSVFGRASVNSPNVAYDEVKGSYKEQLRLSIATSHLL